MLSPDRSLYAARKRLPEHSVERKWGGFGIQTQAFSSDCPDGLEIGQRCRYAGGLAGGKWEIPLNELQPKRFRLKMSPQQGCGLQPTGPHTYNSDDGVTSGIVGQFDGHACHMVDSGLGFQDMGSDMKLKSIKLLTLLFVLVLVLAGATVRRAFAVTAAVPTAGLAVTSVVVGAAGVLDGGWFTRIAGYAVGLIDPDPGTFYEGKIVITYPEDLLAVRGVGWFGNFAEDPSDPVPPVVLDPFFEYDTTTIDDTFLQPPNPALVTSTSDSGGVVTVEFDASPSGVTVESGAHFNLLSIMFQNISGQALEWKLADAGKPANFFSNPEQQILTCRPDFSFPDPVTCGVDAPPYRYQVSVVPPVPTLSQWGMIILTSLLLTFVTIAIQRHLRFRAQTQ